MTDNRERRYDKLICSVFGLRKENNTISFSLRINNEYGLTFDLSYQIGVCSVTASTSPLQGFRGVRIPHSPPGYLQQVLIKVNIFAANKKTLVRFRQMTVPFTIVTE